MYHGRSPAMEAHFQGLFHLQSSLCPVFSICISSKSEDLGVPSWGNAPRIQRNTLHLSTCTIHLCNTSRAIIALQFSELLILQVDRGPDCSAVHLLWFTIVYSWSIMVSGGHTCWFLETSEDQCIYLIRDEKCIRKVTAVRLIKEMTEPRHPALIGVCILLDPYSYN